ARIEIQASNARSAFRMPLHQGQKGFLPPRHCDFGNRLNAIQGLWSARSWILATAGYPHRDRLLRNALNKKANRAFKSSLRSTLSPKSRIETHRASPGIGVSLP